MKIKKEDIKQYTLDLINYVFYDESTYEEFANLLKQDNNLYKGHIYYAALFVCCNGDITRVKQNINQIKLNNFNNKEF